MLARFGGLGSPETQLVSTAWHRSRTRAGCKLIQATRSLASMGRRARRGLAAGNRGSRSQASRSKEQHDQGEFQGANETVINQAAAMLARLLNRAFGCGGVQVVDVEREPFPSSRRNSSRVQSPFFSSRRSKASTFAWEFAAGVAPAPLAGPDGASGGFPLSW